MGQSRSENFCCPVRLIRLIAGSRLQYGVPRVPVSKITKKATGSERYIYAYGTQTHRYMRPIVAIGDTISSRSMPLYLQTVGRVKVTRRTSNAPLTPRTDRRDRLDVAVYRSGAWPLWTPQWDAIGNAWLPSDGAIADEARQDIEQVVNGYLRNETIARAVPFRQDIADRIRRLHTAAAAFAAALRAFRQGDGSREARSRLTACLVTAAEDDPHLERVPRDLRDIIQATDMVLADLDAEAPDVRPFKKWGAWDILIQRLHDIAVKHRLPTSIDNHKINDGDPVPFIDAIMAIETTLPENFQRYDTRASLAKAVLRILRNNRKSDAVSLT